MSLGDDSHEDWTRKCPNNLSCQQQVAGGESKADALYGSVCTISLSSIILLAIGIFLMVIGFAISFPPRKKPFNLFSELVI